MRTFLASLVPVAPLAVLTVFAAGCPCPDGQEGCGTTTPEPADITAIRLDGGDGQVGPVGQVLSTSLSVRLYDPGNDQPRSGTVRFSIESGGGHLAIDQSFGGTFTGANQVLEVPVDAGGFAGARLVLGPNPGQNTVRAKSISRDNYIQFTATGHGPATTVTISHGDGQTAEAGAELPDRVSVKVTDASGIQVPGMRVWFYPNAGEPVSGEVTTTSRTGVATMPSRWRLGLVVGTQTLDARVLEGPSGPTLAAVSGNPIRFTATAIAPAPASVARNPANFPEPQSGTAGAAVAIKPSVKVLSSGGWPIPGVPVRFVVTAGNGTLGGLVTTHVRATDAAGVATVPDWILGSPGPNTVTATVEATGVSGNPVVFTANATAPALQLAISAGDQQAVPVGMVTPVKPRVRVTNQTGVGVGGIPIRWSVVQGSGSFLPAEGITDGEGFAQLDYFAPTAVGVAQLRATTTDLRVAPTSVTFAITATPRP